MVLNFRIYRTFFHNFYIVGLIRKVMPDLEVRVLGSSGRGKSGVSVKLDFTGEWLGLGDQPWGFSEEERTDDSGSAYFSFDSDYDGAPFDLYVDHNKEGEYNLGRDTYIEVGLSGEDDEEDD